MTNFANKYNKSLSYTRKKVENAQYFNLKDLFTKYGNEHLFIIQALYINKKSKYGDSPVSLVNGNLVNMPSHLTDVVKEMIKDDELTMAINEDKFGFKIYQYTNDNGTSYSVNWIDTPF